MTVEYLEHVNMRTADLDRMTRFYEGVLGMKVGPRPAFEFNGTWLYCGKAAAIHLVEDLNPLEVGSPQIEHFAFRAKGLAAFLDTLRGEKIPYECRIVPGLEIRQVHTVDPDGNHVEVAFAPEEEADLTNYAGD